MKVRATNKYEKLGIKDAELGRIVKAGEEFEITKERYNVLHKNNKFKVSFVEEVKEIKTETKTVKKETAKRKTTPKKKDK